MKTTLAALALTLWLPSAVGAQEEPELFPEPAPSPTPAPASPAAPLPPGEVAPVPMKPLSDRLDFARWQEMSPRERQTFVEGAVSALAASAGRLRAVANDPRLPPDRQSALAQLLRDITPRRSTTTYLREMYKLYHTEQGRKMTMTECFLKAFGSLNAI